MVIIGMGFKKEKTLEHTVRCAGTGGTGRYTPIPRVGPDLSPFMRNQKSTNIKG